MKIPLAMALLLLSPLAQADENFRCGKWIASSDLSVADLLGKCGQPASRESRVEDVLARNANTGLMYKIGETQVEILTFDRGATAPPMVVTVIDGRIKTIERRKP
jgi:hypothetical protein